MKRRIDWFVDLGKDWETYGVGFLKEVGWQFRGGGWRINRLFEI